MPEAKQEKSTYASSGVDISAANNAIKSMISILGETAKFRKGKLGEVGADIGHYANFIDIGAKHLLVLSCDQVGTKVLVAEEANKFDTIGIDMIAMNVNDVICVGAEPIALTDYIALENMDAKMALEIAKGIAEGAREAQIAVVGGETAALKGVITGVGGKGFDLSGTCLGIVEKNRLVLGDKIAPGDKIIGLPSTGIHSNGYTLVRKVILGTFEAKLPKVRKSKISEKYNINDTLPWGKKVSDELLTPTKIYVKPVLSVLEKNFSEVTGLAHITGSGFRKITRINGKVGFKFTSLLPAQKIFGEIQKLGNVDDKEMFSTFNMGMGFAIIARRPDGILRTLKDEGIDAKVVGEVTNRAGVVEVLEKNIEIS